MSRRAVCLVLVVACAACGQSAMGGPDAGMGTDLLGGTGDAGVTQAMIPIVVRDFRFCDFSDPTTNPDFEDPPFGVGPNGQSSPGYMGPWDDPGLVEDTLGPDNKPVYQSANAGTLTTHGKAGFDQWYRDTLGVNWQVQLPLALVGSPGQSLQYDSEKQGVPYGSGVPDMGNGFFPIDDQGPHATPFGNQGKTHNYSFTVEIHTVFTYAGGETFSFRGDDDVFVFINQKLVIDLGGIHGPEQMQVNVDSLGLTKGQVYPLDFFSAERHVTGSNIEFETTLDLKPVPTQ